MSGSRIAPAPPDGSPRRPDGMPDQSRGREQAGGFLKRAEVRDVLAWMRLLVDPQDAAAVVRALSRPPIALRQVELARVIQVARRRKLDLVGGLAAATESPQVPPEARERIQRFVELHRAAAAELDTVAPDVFIGRLIQRLGVRGRALLAPDDAAEQRAGLELLHGLAVDFVRATPRASTRDLARHLATVVPEAQGEARVIDPSPAPAGDQAEEGDTGGPGDHAYAGLHDQEPVEEEPVDALHATFQLLREEVLEGVARIGGRLGELRLDTDLDISHGLVRYLELLKLSALLQRPEGQSLADALADVNARLLAAATPLQREILQTSALDDTLLADERGEGIGDRSERDAGAGERARASAVAPREEHSLGPFLPRRGVGLALSASDIHTYRSCPLRYKYARVLRIPTEQTVHQRFGIVVHQVLERYHADGADTLAQMLGLLDASWRRAGFGESERDRELLDKARAALTRYHARLHDQDSEPVWFERQFDFRVGPHHLRGRVDRVDRVDRLRDDEYELIDYKTSRPKSAEQLRDDIQLSLYALAAREDWGLESSRQAYYYVLDDLKVPVTRGAHDAEAVKDIVLEVGEGILAQEFEPTPSPSACSICDYRIVCPAAEA
ncbi:MAG TPA: PD-(D/E)XK nuclease family protein [Solirubrobacteraceae bacterium]|nr:PD-(D/E)XK nuclease family protein [Solirubrobacteraceae bacterium]